MTIYIHKIKLSVISLHTFILPNYIFYIVVLWYHVFRMAHSSEAPRRMLKQSQSMITSTRPKY